MFFQDKESSRYFEILQKSIDRQECAVFIGAGISIPAGYPSLPSLLYGMAESTNITIYKNYLVLNYKVHLR